jgi:hypothetical protein
MKQLWPAFALACFALPFLQAAQTESGLDPVSVDRLLAQAELSNLESRVALLVLPMPFGEAYQKVGGKDVLDWSYGTAHADRAREVFAVEKGHLIGKGYVVVFEGAEITNGKSLITRIAVGFRTLLGPTYYADPKDASKIVMPDLGNGSNQLPDPTPALVMPPAGAGATPRLGADH